MPYCTGCEQDLEASAFAKDKHRATGLRYRCRACSAREFKSWQKTDGYNARLRKGAETRLEQKRTNPKSRWADMALANARKRAKQAGMLATITKAWLLENTPDTCPLLEIPLAYDNTRTSGNSPSLDRIDSSEGYVDGNCWVISSLANRMKNDATVEQVEMLAKNLRVAMDKGLIKLTKPPVSRDGDRPPPKEYRNPYSQ